MNKGMLVMFQRLPHLRIKTSIHNTLSNMTEWMKHWVIPYGEEYTVVVKSQFSYITANSKGA